MQAVGSWYQWFSKRLHALAWYQPEQRGFPERMQAAVASWYQWWFSAERLQALVGTNWNQLDFPSGSAAWKIPGYISRSENFPSS
jgi:hypothetical protein